MLNKWRRRRRRSRRNRERVRQWYAWIEGHLQSCNCLLLDVRLSFHKRGRRRLGLRCTYNNNKRRKRRRLGGHFHHCCIQLWTKEKLQKSPNHDDDQFFSLVAQLWPNTDLSLSLFLSECVLIHQNCSKMWMTRRVKMVINGLPPFSTILPLKAGKKRRKIHCPPVRARTRLSQRWLIFFSFNTLSTKIALISGEREGDERFVTNDCTKQREDKDSNR